MTPPRLVEASHSQRGGGIADGSFFQKCVSVIMRSSAYPAGFVSWATNRTGTREPRPWLVVTADCLGVRHTSCRIDVAGCCSADLEESDFNRYRGQLCSDALSALAGELGIAAYLQYIGTLLQQFMASGANWVDVEMVLFATRVAHLQVRSWRWCGGGSWRQNACGLGAVNCSSWADAKGCRLRLQAQVVGQCLNACHTCQRGCADQELFTQHRRGHASQPIDGSRFHDRAVWHHFVCCPRYDVLRLCRGSVLSLRR